MNLAELLGKELPHDIRLEMSALGAAILSSEAADQVIDLVAREDFYRSCHQEIYDCIVAMRAAGVPVDAESLRMELTKRKAFTGNFTPVYLHDLMQACPAASNASTYARAIADLASRRRSIETFIRALQKSFAPDANLPEIIAETTTALQLEAQLVDTAGPSWVSLLTAGGSFVLDVPSTPPAVWGEGEQIGWAEGEALLIAGPPGVGKTTLVDQLVAGRLGLTKEVLGMPVRPGDRRVLYLAMDRPPQIARAMGRLFTADDRAVLDERLIVWKGPPPGDFARDTGLLAAMCRHADADTVIVDSLKDGVLKLTDDESGSGYNRARQQTLTEGVEVVELHHQRKANGENKKPTKLDDVYGSAWITAGAGSVIGLWGQAGDPVVELLHLKQPMEPLGPWQIVHDHVAGRSSIHHQADLFALAQTWKPSGSHGLTAKAAACALFNTDKPSAAEVQKARRRLDRYVNDGLMISRPGATTTEPTVYFRADAERKGPAA